MVAGVTAPRAAPAGAEPAPRLSIRRELVIGLAVFAVYGLVESLPVADREAAAERHSRALHALQQSLHIDFERPMNEWLAAHPTLAVPVNYEYATTYVISAAMLLVWLFRCRPGRYRVARNSFAMINLVAVVCFAVYPLTPPRLLPDLGFVDTVRLGGTWGSWGTPLIDSANQHAAMPSLHVAWALWVSVELARLSARRWVQAVSLVHVLVTILVTMATANHYLMDAAGAVLLVWLCVRLAERWTGVPGGQRVGPADAFFLAVETPGAPQHVGGVILLNAPAETVGRDRLAEVVGDRLAGLPRFRQRLAPGGRGRRPVWSDHGDIDWEWHVTVRDLPAPGGTAALDRLVAELQSVPLPRDRPLWRLVLVRGYAAERCAVIFLMHHVVADGIGVIAHAVRLMEPALPHAQDKGGSPAGPMRTVAGTATGLLQLAGERRQGERLPSGTSAARRFGTFGLSLDEVRGVARRHGARVSDVLLCAVSGGLSRLTDVGTGAGTRTSGGTGASRGDGRPGRLRVSVPLMMRGPSTRPEGNYTAAVMVDVPVGPMAEVDRLAAITARTGRLYSGTRALASWFVMRRVALLLPPPLHAAFARAVYGGPTFQATVSNLPGLDTDIRLAGAPLLAVHPILPTARGAPLSVGALSWRGRLGFGISAEAALVDEAAELCDAMQDAIAELEAAAPASPVDSVTSADPVVPPDPAPPSDQAADVADGGGHA